MTVAVGGHRTSLPAAADLSTTGQFVMVSVDANGRGTPGGAGATIIGIGQNKPGAADRGYGIQTDGVSKLIIGGTVNEGDRLRATATGTGTATTTDTDEYGAIALEAGASGAVIRVLVTPGGRFAG